MLDGFRNLRKEESTRARVFKDGSKKKVAFSIALEWKVGLGKVERKRDTQVQKDVHALTILTEGQSDTLHYSTKLRAWNLKEPN